jgi:hypothetical protein
MRQLTINPNLSVPRSSLPAIQRQHRASAQVNSSRRLRSLTLPRAPRPQYRPHRAATCHQPGTWGRGPGASSPTRRGDRAKASAIHSRRWCSEAHGGLRRECGRSDSRRKYYRCRCRRAKSMSLVRYYRGEGFGLSREEGRRPQLLRIGSIMLVK